MRKTLLTLLCALALTGCSAADDDMTTHTQQPTATVTNGPTGMPVVPFDEGDGMMDGVMDGVTDGVTDGMTDTMENNGNGTLPGTTDMPESTGVTSIDKVGRVIEQIEDELERLSEVDDAQVILAGNKAAVALEFDDQYRGGIDDRLRGVVKDRIASVISGIDTIAITADESVMDAIESLGENVSTLSDMTQLQKDVEAIIRKIGAA